MPLLYNSGGIGRQWSTINIFYNSIICYLRAGCSEPIWRQVVFERGEWGKVEKKYQNQFCHNCSECGKFSGYILIEPRFYFYYMGDLYIIKLRG